MQTALLRRALALPAFFALSLAGCFAGHRSLAGFPPLEGKDAREQADRASLAVRNTEESLLRMGRERTGGDASTCDTVSELRLLDTYVALANDEIAPSTGLPPQGTTTRRPPLFLYPRATCPLIAEASSVGDPLEGRSREWILPVLLNREAFKKPENLSFLLGEALSALLLPEGETILPEQGPELVAALRERLHFTLIPRRRDHHDEIPLDRADTNYVVLPDVDLRQGGRMGGDKGAGIVLRAREDALEIILRLPTVEIEERWKTFAEPPHEELFDLRVFPMIPCGPEPAGGPWEVVLEAFRIGRWPAAHRALGDVVRALDDPTVDFSKIGIDAASSGALADAFEEVGKELLWFRRDLDPVIAEARTLAEAIEESEPRSVLAAHARDLEKAVGTFVEEDPCPAPILLDEPAPRDRSFSFIVGADLQYDSDGSNLAAFLGMIDPASAAESGTVQASNASISPDLESQIRAAKFVMIVGDFGDGKGLSSSGLAPVADALGLSAPLSPYAKRSDPKAGEFPELRAQIGRSSKAILAVPGNHDGFAAYGGILNQLAAGLGYFLRVLPLTSPAGDWLTDDFSPKLPTLIRLLRVTPPFYDGLVDWSYELGPCNVAFQYRGCAFVAANSFDLHQVERDQVGALGNNWGGGLQDGSLVWIDVALRHFSHLDRAARGLEAPSRPAASFLFMHHDPRASLASKTGYKESYFGHYNDITSPMGEATFGWFGFGWASYTGIFLPILSPLTNDVLREAVSGQNFQERWMRHTAWDESCYNARGLIETVNRNLARAPPIESTIGGDASSSASLTHLFFGHDDTPVIGDWVSPNGRAVFPSARTHDEWGGIGYDLEGFFVRSQSSGPPSWANDMSFDDGRNAVVVRMDDLGDLFSSANTHGFHLVTVTFAEGAKAPSIRVRHIRIPH